MAFFIKLVVTAGIIALSSELAKKYSFWGALLLALPFTSLLALFWTYFETRDVNKVVNLSWGVFWLVPPSLVFFPVLAVGLEKGLSFLVAMILAIVSAVLTYFVYAKVLQLFGIQL